MMSADELEKLKIELGVSIYMINSCERGGYSKEFCLKWLKDNGYINDFIRLVMARRGEYERIRRWV